MKQVNKGKRRYTCLHKTLLYAGAGLLLLSSAACNKDFEKKIKLHGPGDTVHVNIQERKVLYLIVDGLRGRILPQINPPVIMEMTRNSLYAFDGVCEPDAQGNAKEIVTWADMLTGVKSNKHKVTGDDLAGNDLEEYPMFFSRLKQADPAIRTTAFCSSSLLSDQLISDADVNKSFNGDDAAVKNAVISELQNDADASVVLAEFGSVESAGRQDGYDSASTAYKTAIMQVDGYIGEILDALKKRKNYGQENWLVIVASNQGGPIPLPPDYADKTVFGNPRLNDFIIFYNPRFTGRFIPKPNTANLPYQGYAVMLQDNGDDAVNASVPVDEADVYNFGSSGGYTVQLKIKVFSWGSVWPSFFGKKSTSLNSSVPGWIFMFHGANQWRVKIGGSGKDKTTQVENFNADEWHTLTLKVYEEGGSRYAAIYTDGNKSNTLDITGMNTDNDEPLTAGWIDGWDGTYSNLYITDVKIWKAALPDSIIAADGGKVGLDSASAYYPDVIGYWPCLDGIGDKFADHGPYGNDMLFHITDKNKQEFQWQKFSDTTGLVFPPMPPGLEAKVPQGIDIPFMIYDWMGVQASGWGLDGKAWIPDYKDMEK